jgi:hypothetical protein
VRCAGSGEAIASTLRGPDRSRRVVILGSSSEEDHRHGEA